VVIAPQNGAGTSFLVATLERPALVAVGVISYSVFLWHEPIVRFLHDHGVTMPGVPGLGLNLVLVAAATVPLSMLTYRSVETPALTESDANRIDWLAPVGRPAYFTEPRASLAAMYWPT
jgi:peptidoglycan/LPS O-acetylase OafA/YrhL